MGLAAAQARFLTLTSRKADCEYGMTIGSTNKMALTREMTELSQEYYSKLQAKKISYYHNGQYYKMNYNYLMGKSHMTYDNLTNENIAKKSDTSMILTDYNGRVVISNDYAKCFLDAGLKLDEKGRGGTFSTNEIPKILAKITGNDAEKFKEIINDNKLNNSYKASVHNTLYGDDTGEDRVVENGDSKTNKYKALVDYYYPILVAAASNGWTTEYNKEMAANENYISDALVTGSFQLVTTDAMGNYDERGSLTYFITAGMIQERTHSDEREAITAWYEEEKAIISEKETLIDLKINDLSVELEAINTEIQSIQSLIDDAISSVFDWGGG